MGESVLGVKENSREKKKTTRNLDSILPLSFYASFMVTPCSLLTPFP